MSINIGVDTSTEQGAAAALTINGIINGVVVPGAWRPPEPYPAPDGWGGWAVVQEGLPSFERAKYLPEERGGGWRWRGWGPWRRRDGFIGCGVQAARILRDGYMLSAQMIGSELHYKREPLTPRTIKALRDTVRRSRRAQGGTDGNG